MESSKFNYNDQPFLVKLGLAISSIGCMWHTDGFKAVIRYIYFSISISAFKFGYKHFKWFRKRMIKKFNINGADPFLTFFFIQLLTGNLFDFEKTMTEEYIKQYIKDSELSEEDANKLRKSILEFRNKTKIKDVDLQPIHKPYTDNEV